MHASSGVIWFIYVLPARWCLLQRPAPSRVPLPSAGDMNERMWPALTSEAHQADLIQLAHNFV
jgi:hypothetical protein